jgi:hypothetical protein
LPCCPPWPWWRVSVSSERYRTAGREKNVSIRASSIAFSVKTQLLYQAKYGWGQRSDLLNTLFADSSFRIQHTLVHFRPFHCPCLLVIHTLLISQVACLYV